jgi:hypothetical protein
VILALILLQVAAQPPAVAPPSPEIEVVGRRLAKLRLDLGIEGFELTGCRVSVSSGDAFVDGQACRAAAICVRRHDIASARLLDCIDGEIVLAVRQHDAPASQR